MDSIQTDDPDQPQASRTLNSSNVQTHRTAPPIFQAIIWIIIAVAIIVGLVFGARWLYHRHHHKANPAPATTTRQPSVGTPSKTSGGSTANNTPAQPGGTTSSTSTNQLTNTGPGNVAVIFITASLAAGGLHYIISLRKANSN